MMGELEPLHAAFYTLKKKIATFFCLHHRSDSQFVAIVIALKSILNALIFSLNIYILEVTILQLTQKPLM